MAADATEIALAAAVGVTCVLSILGSGIIILSYILFRELRTTMRYILLQLSIADFVVAAANLFGVLYSFQFPADVGQETYDPVCIAQAAIALLGTDASILWTMIFISYVYMLITCYKPKRSMNITVLTLLSLFSWIIPLVLVLVYSAKGYFGYDPGFSPGFCTIYAENKTEMFRTIVGYEIFLYSSFLVLPIVSTLFVCHLYSMVSR